MAGLEDLYARGLISPDALADVLDRAGPEQRLSRSDILASGLDRAKEYLAPSYLRDTPSSPEADRALADPNGKPGKIGPPSGPPTTAQMIGGFAGDVGLNALPFGKLAPELAVIPFWLKAGTGPRMAARADALREAGHGLRYIADDLGVGKASVGRYFNVTGQKTAAAENPSVWTPETEAQLIAYRKQGVSHPAIAQKMGLSFKQVDSKVYALKDAGRIPDDVRRWEPFINDPEKTAEFVRDVNEGWSQSALDRKYGWAEGSGKSSMRIKQLQERGDIPKGSYVPQGGTGLTPAGRTPTTAKTKTQARRITPEDLEFGQDFSKALSTFLPNGPAR